MRISIRKIINNIAWFYRECRGICHECKKGYMSTEGEANGDAFILGHLPMMAHCTNCSKKGYI